MKKDKDTIIVSSLLKNGILNELNNLGVTCILGGHTNNINNETAFHPDMLYYPLISGGLLTERGFNSVHNLDTFAKVHESELNVNNLYPNDCIMNCFVAGQSLICGKSAAPEILNDAENNGYNIITVKQGYASCSTVKLYDDSYICSDKGISQALSKLGLDVLLVDNNGICLNGYSCGFIGGCVLYSNKELVAFSGNIKAHKDYASIKAFCANHGISIYALSNECLYDYGGFIRVRSNAAN